MTLSPTNPHRRILMAIASVTLSALLILAGTFPVSSQTAPDRIDALLNSMSLEQQIGQLFMVSFKGVGVNDTTAVFLRAMQPGSAALFSTNGTDPQSVTRTTNAIQEIGMEAPSAIPLILSIDQEGGTVNRLSTGFTKFPWGGALGAMPSPDVELIGAMTATELRAVGISMNLAPVVDVRRDPNVRFMERRAFGFDPERVGKAGSAYVTGMRSAGAIGAFKHFPGHGAAGDSHNYLPVIEDSRSVLLNTDLVPFRIGIADGADVIMMGHISVPALEPDAALPASLSHKVITGLLREQMGFKGVVMTDALDMGAIVDRFTRPRSAVMTILAGADVITAGPNTPLNDQLAMKDAVIDAVKGGELTPDRIRTSARRILLLKERFDLLDWSSLDDQSAPERVRQVEHADALTDIYKRTVAISRDQFDLLPLRADKDAGIAVIFPGIYPAVGRICTTYDQTLRQYAYPTRPTDADIVSVRQLAEKSRAVIIFTYNMRDNVAQAALVNAISREKAILVALQNPYDIETGVDPGAYVVSFNTEVAAFEAACGVLFGAYPARGIW